MIDFLKNQGLNLYTEKNLKLPINSMGDSTMLKESTCLRLPGFWDGLYIAYENILFLKYPKKKSEKKFEPLQMSLQLFKQFTIDSHEKTTLSLCIFVLYICSLLINYRINSEQSTLFLCKFVLNSQCIIERSGFYCKWFIHYSDMHTCYLLLLSFT